MIVKQIKRLLAILIVLFTASELFAVDEYVSKIYKDIDIVFVQKSDAGLNDILQTNKEDKNYYLIENYAEKKIRRLIVVNDYEFAMDAIVVVIENNLDNEEAVEMYSIIAEAYEVQQEYEAQQELLRQQEIARIEGEKEKQRGNAEKEYVSSKSASGGSVYVTGKETRQDNYLCDFSFGMANFALTSDFDTSYTATNYGLSANLNYVYLLEKIMAGIDVYGAINFLSISQNNDGIPLITNIDIAGKIGNRKFLKNGFLRAGISMMNTGKTADNKSTETIAGSLISPFIGFSFDDVSLGPASFTFNADYLLAPLWSEDYKQAFQGGLDLALPYAQLERVNLNFHIGVKDKFLTKDSGNENRAAIYFAIGAENANR